MPLLKTELPRFGEDERLTDKVNKIYTYLEQLQPALNFVLSHLNGSNLNGNGLTMQVKTQDGKTELGSIGAAGSGVGLMSGMNGLRVGPAGIEITADGGRNWTGVEL